MRTALVMAAMALALLLVVPGLGLGEEAGTERVSVGAGGVEGNLASQSPAIDDDGRVVAFSSEASNFVPGDVNAHDVFVHDRQTAATELVSVSTNGAAQANRAAIFPDISGDGRYVAFTSRADNLVLGDTNESDDVFVHDREDGTTELVSKATGGTIGNDHSVSPSISADGRYVTFTSRADNLVVGDVNGSTDVFLHDRDAGTTELVSVDSDETPGNFASGGSGAGPGRVSGDGRYVVFGSFADNLVAGDTNADDDVFLRDRLLGTTERISVANDGTEGNNHSIYGDVSDDGQHVVFESAADNLTPGDANGASDILLRDRAAGTTVRLSDASPAEQANGASHQAEISGDGTTVVFHSNATNLVAGDGNAAFDVFRIDIASLDIDRVSVANGGGEADGLSRFASLSLDGAAVAFESEAMNLVGGDTNEATDVFVRGKTIAMPATPTATVVGPATPTPTSTPSLLGDVDCDGNVRSLDAALLLQLDAGVIPGPLPCPANADASQDGIVNTVDAALVLQVDAGIIPGLPV